MSTHYRTEPDPPLPEYTYTVIEQAGQDSEHTVYGPGSFHDCARFIAKNYNQEEIDRLKVDVLKNGSTEY